MADVPVILHEHYNQFLSDIRSGSLIRSGPDYGKEDFEDAALVHLAEEFDTSVVEFHEVLDQRQPYAGPAGLVIVLDLVVALKNQLLLVFRNPVSGILHGDNGLLPSVPGQFFEAEGYRTLGRVLHRVREKVVHDYGHYIPVKIGHYLRFHLDVEEGILAGVRFREH